MQITYIYSYEYQSNEHFQINNINDQVETLNRFLLGFREVCWDQYPHIVWMALLLNIYCCIFKTVHLHSRPHMYLP